MNENNGGQLNEQLSEQQSQVKKKAFTGGMAVGMGVAFLIICLVYLAANIKRLVDAGSEHTDGVMLREDSVVTQQLINKLMTLEDTIDYYYYLDEVSDEELADGIYSGMLNALGDPYSEYYTAQELNELMEQTEGIYYGIGAHVSMDDSGFPKIADVIENSPAQEAMLRANDIIYKVDGQSTGTLTLTETVSLIKGEEGTQVVLTIIREGEDDYLEIPVTRRQVESPTVEFEMSDESTAYIRITEFDDVTVDQFAEALAMAKGSGMKGLIIDLRSNPGGSLNAVVEIAQMLLPEGMIVYTEDKYGRRMEYTCDGKNKLDVPLVVLVDVNSASASEILAGAVQDYGIGTLVGTTTFGKGIVQQVITMADGSAVKLTISSYFTPNGRNIHGVGIEPDVICEFDAEAYYDSENPYDNQLEKAKEVLRGKLSEDN